jgi:hypothetical protein
MSRAIVVVSDFPSPAQVANPPRLPALEQLIARAAAPPLAAPDWRRWLLQQVGIRLAGERPPLARVARGREGHWLFATPVHLVAGLERVHLHPGGALALDADERAELQHAFTATFGEEGLRLDFDERGEGYIELPHGLDVVTHDPTDALGRIVDDYMPSGPDAAYVKRLFTELQMWLHALPCNAARERAGQLAVNALWLWGAGVGEPDIALPASLPELWSTDACSVGLWRAGGVENQGPGEAVSLWLGKGARRTAATLSLATMGYAQDALAEAERDWFEPLADALKRKRLEDIELWIAGHSVLFSQQDRWRLWRRPRPWYEVLSA